MKPLSLKFKRLPSDSDHPVPLIIRVEDIRGCTVETIGEDAGKTILWAEIHPPSVTAFYVKESCEQIEKLLNRAVEMLNAETF